MYLRFTRRRKNGKEHRYWSIVESRRCTGGRVVQRPVLDLGEINDSQQGAWSRVIEAFDEESQRPRQLALFPAERRVPDHAAGFGVQVRLNAMELHRPRQWGACWLACHLYEQLELDRFWTPRRPDSREGTRWRQILQTLIPEASGDCIGCGSRRARWRICSARTSHTALARRDRRPPRERPQRAAHHRGGPARRAGAEPGLDGPLFSRNERVQ